MSYMFENEFLRNTNDNRLKNGVAAKKRRKLSAFSKKLIIDYER